MAWRIDEAVIRGEIDNREPGRVLGTIWFHGLDSPVSLELDGDAWRDIAGSKLTFVNPEPRDVAGLQRLASQQRGLVGDITASLKRRVLKVDPRVILARRRALDPTESEWRNALYIEWFSSTNGRVLIESVDFHLELGDYEWRMDEDAEEAQKLANMQAMRDFLQQLIGRTERGDRPKQSVGEWDEFEWERLLKESDRVTDAFTEASEKYQDEPDSEHKEAFVMGWDGLLNALADSEENAEWHAVDDWREDEEPDECEEEGEEPAWEPRARHPLQAKAHELAMRAMDIVPDDGKDGTPAAVLIGNLLQVTGKLAGVWCDGDEEDDVGPERGYVLAVLKRCLGWLNDAIGACAELENAEADPDQRAALAHIRTSVFEVRDDITELRRELKS